MRVQQQTTPKPVNERLPDGTFRANEDALAVKKEANGLAAAVCDGAGGSGLFSGEWAQWLASQLPETPLRNYEDLSGWIGDIWQPFYETCEAKTAGDTIRANKFYAEGSCATLAAVWLTEDGRNMHWATYGDSCIFVFSEGYQQCILQTPVKKFADFQHFPMLVNWHEDFMRPAAFSAGALALPEKSEIWIASDALSMHLYCLAYLLDNEATMQQQLPTGKHLEVWQQHGEITAIEARQQLFTLKNSLPAHFGWEMKRLEKKGQILNDDCSLIVIET